MKLGDDEYPVFQVGELSHVKLGDDEYPVLIDNDDAQSQVFK